jgi:hypothetical protein
VQCIKQSNYEEKTIFSATTQEWLNQSIDVSSFMSASAGALLTCLFPW